MERAGESSGTIRVLAKAKMYQLSDLAKGFEGA
jgi:hypothetical protein